MTLPLSAKRAGATGKTGAALDKLGLRESAAEGLITEDEAADLLDSLLAIRSQIARARRFGLTLTTDTLRHKAMSLAECFVDPTWADEAREQLTADQARLSPGASARAIDETCGF